MVCKKCGAELEDGLKVCPECDAKLESNDKAVKILVAAICLVVLAGVLVVAVLKSVNSNLFGGGETTPVVSGQEQQESTPSVEFISHSADDATITANRDAVVATVGDYQLTVSQLQLYYWFQVSGYYQKYFDYISAGYLRLDVTQPLSEQVCAEDQTISWEEYFIKKAITTWQRNAMMNMLADQDNFQLEESFMDELKASHQADAAMAGYDSVESYLQAMMKRDVGNTVIVQDYWDYMEFSNRATAYFAQWYEQVTPTAEEMEAYYTEHEKTFVDQGQGKDAGYNKADVRHILIMVGEDTDAGWKLAEAEAQRILQEFKDGGATEEVFAQLANKYSADGGSNTNGGLYSNVPRGQMVEVFNNWIMDGSRKYGDTDILKADYHYQGYHIMFFVKGMEPVWESAVLQAIISERSSELVDTSNEKWPMEKQEENILLGTPNFDN